MNYMLCQNSLNLGICILRKTRTIKSFPYTSSSWSCVVAEEISFWQYLRMAARLHFGIDLGYFNTFNFDKKVRNHDNNMHLLLKIWPSERQAYFTGQWKFTRTAKILSFYNTCELSMQKIKRYFYYSITFSYCLDFFKIWTFSYLLRIPFLLSRQDIFPGDWLGGVICCSCIGRGWNCNEDGISELRMAYGNYKSRKNWCRLKWCEYFPQEPYFEKELFNFCSTKNSKSISALLIWY